MSLPARYSRDRDPAPDSVALGALVQRMALGDEDALGALYDVTSRWVYGIATKILSDAGAAEEVTLDVYNQAWMRAATFNSKRGQVHTWLLAMARSRSIDRLRSRARSQSLETSLEPQVNSAMDPRPDPSVEAMLSERGTRVRKALSDLSLEHREVIELAFFHGLSHGRIAAHLALPLGTVKTRIRAGVRTLAERLAEDEA